MYSSKIVELNIGGQYYTTFSNTLTQEPTSKLAKWFLDLESCELPKDRKGRYFIDRDGLLFRYILDYLRHLKNLPSSLIPINGAESRDVSQVICNKPLNEEENKNNELKFDMESVGDFADDVLLDGDPNRNSPEVSEPMLITPITCRGPLLVLKQRLLLPNAFAERPRLREEAEYYELQGLIAWLDHTSPKNYMQRAIGGNPVSTITLTYRGTYASGRDGLSDIKFRKLSRILVCGLSVSCREVFGETLNDSRDPHHGPHENRYTSRYFLKHSVLELALDNLYEHGYKLVGCSGTGANNAVGKTQHCPDWEEGRWHHCHEYIFVRFSW